MLKFFTVIRNLRGPKALRNTAIFAAVLIASLLAATDQILAQSGGDDLQKAIQAIGGSQGNASGVGSGANLPQTITLQPASSSGTQLPTSRLEKIMSKRARETLQQFGYDELAGGQSVNIPQAGAVQDNYILGPGDEIVISLRGQDNSEFRAQVDRNGQVTIPRVSPILAAGRSLADFRQDVEREIRRAYISTQAFVSLGQLRQISVMVTGEVNTPGMRLVTGLSTPLDAIILSGGVKKTGSLRSVKLIHGTTRTLIDLYAVLSQHGTPRRIQLSDGDRIIVPSLGPTVAIAGWLRKPGIYELAPGTNDISIRNLIALAGGLEVRGAYRLSLLHVDTNGTNSLTALKLQSGILRDGDLLFALPGADQIDRRAILSGGTGLAGQYAVGTSTTLSQVLKAPGALGANPYTLFGLIVRHDPVTKFVSLISFTPSAVLEAREDVRLNSDDIIRIFSRSEALLLSGDIMEFRKELSQSEKNTHSPLEESQKELAAGKNQNDQELGTTLSEREIVATISTKALGAGGVLSNRLPTNEFPPFGLTAGQIDYLNSAKPPYATSSSSPPFSSQNSGGTSSSEASPQGASGSQLPITANSSLAAVLASQSLASAANGTNSSSSLAGIPSLSDIQPSAALPTPLAQTSNLDLEPAPDSVMEFPFSHQVETFGQLTRQLQVDPVVLMHFLVDQSMTISGAVQGPGIYLIGPGTTVQDIVAAAGGTTNWTDLSHVELISSTISPELGRATTEHRIVALTDPAVGHYELHPRDELRLNNIDSVLGAGTVTLQGQVRYSGTYDIERGEHLSELLLRAGGLTDVAYPYGTVFLRQSAASVERDGYRRAAAEMQSIIAADLSRIGQDKLSPDAFTAINAYATEIGKTPALGRISITADPAMLAANPSRDPLLEAGDVIFVPQRPSTVTVLGQVNQPGSFLYSPTSSVEDYVDRAGGYTALSDKSLTFVVLPDGTAHPAGTSWLNFSSDSLPPGSTIVVERDVAPLDTRQLILDVTGILQNLAISAASLAVISKN